MSKKVEITADPKRPNKYDSEYFTIDINGRFEKSEVRHIIEKLDNVVHK